MNRKPPIPAPEELREIGLQSLEDNVPPRQQVRWARAFRLLFSRELMARFSLAEQGKGNPRPLATVHPIGPKLEEKAKRKD